MASISFPPVILQALAAGADLAVSNSGGKDSQAMLADLAKAHKAAGWTGELISMHADLGRAEWPQTLGHVERITKDAGARFIVARRTGDQDLVDRIEAERERTLGSDKLFWPSSRARYCTADLKRDPMIREQRRLGRVIIATQGIRAAESPVRKRRNPLTIEGRATSEALCSLTPEQALESRQPKQRLILNWLPIFSYNIEDVWASCGTSGADLARRQAMYRAADAIGDRSAAAEAFRDWPAHPAYVAGASRLSCALCVMAKKADLIVGARHNPDLLKTYVEMEQISGQTFQPRQSLLEISVIAAAQGAPVPISC